MSTYNNVRIIKCHANWHDQASPQQLSLAVLQYFMCYHLSILSFNSVQNCLLMTFISVFLLIILITVFSKFLPIMWLKYADCPLLVSILR